MPAHANLARELDNAIERHGKEKQLYARLNEMNETAKREGRDFNDDEKREWSDKAAELEAISAQRGRDQALTDFRSAIAEESNMPTERDERRIENMDAREIKIELGHAAQQILRAKGIAPNIKQRDIVMTTGASGGYILGEQMLMRIMAVNPEREIIRSRAMVIPSGEQPNAPFEIPYLDQSGGVAGGLTYAKRKETDSMTESDMDFGQLRLEAEEQSTYIQIGKKTAANGDAVSLGSFIANAFLLNKRATEDYLFFNGSGTNEPLGLINCPAKLAVTRDTSASIKFTDISSMYVRMLDNSGAIWVTNKRAMAQIMEIADTNGNNLIFRPGNISAGTPNTLLNYPLFETTNVPALGSEGDLMFVNPNYYIIKDGRPFELTIYDVRPTTQMLDYVGLWDVDAACWVSAPIQFKDGNTYSPIVVLE